MFDCAADMASGPFDHGAFAFGSFVHIAASNFLETPNEISFLKPGDPRGVDHRALVQLLINFRVSRRIFRHTSSPKYTVPATVNTARNSGILSASMPRSSNLWEWLSFDFTGRSIAVDGYVQGF